MPKLAPHTLTEEPPLGGPLGAPCEDRMAASNEKEPAAAIVPTTPATETVNRESTEKAPGGTRQVNVVKDAHAVVAHTVRPDTDAVGDGFKVYPNVTPEIVTVAPPLKGEFKPATKELTGASNVKTAAGADVPRRPWTLAITFFTVAG